MKLKRIKENLNTNVPENLINILKEADLYYSVKDFSIDDNYYYIYLNSNHVEWEHLNILSKNDLEYKVMLKNSMLTLAILQISLYLDK